MGRQVGDESQLTQPAVVEHQHNGTPNKLIEQQPDSVVDQPSVTDCLGRVRTSNETVEHELS